jgi:hypothetical protein
MMRIMLVWDDVECYRIMTDKFNIFKGQVVGSVVALLVE